MKCSVVPCDPIDESDTFWEFGDIVLCQNHWEAYSSGAWWDSHGGVYETETNDLEIFVVRASDTESPAQAPDG